MSGKTSIEWTDATWNPIRGCSRVSEGCKNCYAERVAARFSGRGMPYAGTVTDGRWNGAIRVVDEALEQPLRWKKPRRIFVNSMSDLFHENLSDGYIWRIFNVMRRAPQHTFQVLTKRPARMLSWFEFIKTTVEASGLLWPLPNVWLGVSVENQRTADERIPLLIKTPAAVRFLSCEPLLGPLDLQGEVMRTDGPGLFSHGPSTAFLDWIIVGGESGPRARPCMVTWIESLVRQGRVGGVPVFVKQLGACPWWPDADVKPIEPARGKCDDPGQWPEALRVREFPRINSLEPTT